MKKVLLIVIAVAAIAVAVVVGTRLSGPSGPRVTEPFTFDYKLDAQNVKFFTEGDDMAMLLSSSPFYASAQPLPGQKTEEFDEARASKVEQIMAESDATAEAAIALKSDVAELRKALCDYLTVCVNNDPATRSYVTRAGKEILRLYTMEAVMEAEYKSIDTSSAEPLTKTRMQYFKCAKAVQLATAYLQDMDNLAILAAVALDQLSGSKNAKIGDANKKLDDAMGRIDKISGQIEEVGAGVRRVNYGLQQLATADYYYARAAVKFMRNSMPELKAAASNMKPNQYVDAEQIAFAKEYLDKFDNFSAEFQQYLDSVSKASLVPVQAAAPAPSGCAYAEQASSGYREAYISAVQPIKDPGEPKPGWLETGWEGAKTFGRGVRTAVHGTQSVLGAGADVLGAAAANASQIGCGIYYGNSASEIWQDMRANSQQILTNWNRNESGSQTMRTAYKYFNAVDDGADAAASAGAERAFGKGWTSWGIGKVAKATTGVFTGLGKGISLIGNRQANTSDYVIGVVEVGSAALGGSKLVIKGTQMPEFAKGLAKGSWISGQRLMNGIGKYFQGLERAEIEAGVKQALAEGTSVAALRVRQEAYQATMAAIEASNQALRAEMQNLVKAAMASGGANFKGTLKESMESFIKEKFAKNMEGLASAMASAVGKSPKEFVDSVVASWVDDTLKGLVESALQESPVPQEMVGSWTGTTIFTSVQIPQAAQAKAKKEGCDIAGEFKKLQGKTLATTMRLGAQGGGWGDMSLAIAFGKGSSPINTRYAYNEGVFNVAQAIKDGNLTMRGDATRKTSGYSLSGTIRIRAGGLGTGIVMDGTFDYSK